MAVQGDDWIRGGYVQGERGTVVGGQGSGGRSGFVARSESGDLYVGRDGNVYKHESGQWQGHEDGRWSDVDAGRAPKSTQPVTQDQVRVGLERDAQSRVRTQENVQRRTPAPTSRRGRR